MNPVDATIVPVHGEKFRAGNVKRMVSRANLTPRELSVLKIASDGRTTDEIARALGLGRETVCSHFKKAQRKLGACNRTHAVATAMRHLLIF